MGDTLTKYHWEFLRRNKEYREAWSQLNELTREASYRETSDDYREFVERYKEFVERYKIQQEESSGLNVVQEKEEGQISKFPDRLWKERSLVRGEEMAFARQWNVLPTDPDLTYNEILERKLEDRVSYRPVSICRHKAFPDILRLDINMNVPKERIMKEFKRILDVVHPLIHRLGMKEDVSQKKVQRLQLRLFDTYLQVYDLKQSGRTYEQIGEELFNEMNDESYEFPDPTQRAKDSYRAARRLVRHGLP